MKPNHTVAKLFGSVSTLAVVAGAMALNGVAWGQAGVLAWGGNGQGQCNIPTAALSGVTAIAGGGYHGIALKSGAVLAWGQNDAGQCDIPTAAQSGVTAIACGECYTIAIKGGSVLAWGAGAINEINGGESRQNYGQSIVPSSALSGVTAIAGGNFHTSAIKDGSVLTWGYTLYGICNVPEDAKSGVSAIACGSVHTIALKGGTVLAWGSNEYGQCNIPFDARSGVTAIAGGCFHTVALKNGAVLAWGAGTTNLGAYPEFGQSIIPTDANNRITAIACASLNTIAIGTPLIISGVLPISGPSSGGTNITITGTHFEAPATVTIGGAPSTNIVVVSDTQITATTPAGFPGPAVVTVNSGSSTAFYYRPSCGSDVDNNGVVDSGDLSIVLLDFGSCSESAAVAPQQEPLILQAPEPAKSVPNKK